MECAVLRQRMAQRMRPTCPSSASRPGVSPPPILCPVLLYARSGTHIGQHMHCPVLTYAVLGPAYAMFCTDVRYAATRLLRDV
eukprot:1271907-Rhodomonas_salina.1